MVALRISVFVSESYEVQLNKRESLCLAISAEFVFCV